MDKGARKIMITQELDPQDGREGMWTRPELMRMNARFEVAMARALSEERERSVAKATSEHPRRGSRSQRGMKNRAA
jgi:hypothetical protein